MNKPNHSKILILIIIIISLSILYLYYDPEISLISDYDKLAEIEIKYNKKYPIGNDYFRIIHYPKYKSFFDQFYDQKYMIYKPTNSTNILATCCWAYIPKIRSYYVCDLKSYISGKNITYRFYKYAFFRWWLKDFRSFGIVMQPNKIISNLKKKWIFSIYPFNKLSMEDYGNLYLYQISYAEYLRVRDILEHIFPNHYFVSGFKRLILESTNKAIKLVHIATPSDNKYIKQNQQKQIIGSGYNIMFCLYETNVGIDLLLNNNIVEQSQMSIIGNNMENCDWHFIRTYMV